MPAPARRPFPTVLGSFQSGKGSPKPFGFSTEGIFSGDVISKTLPPPEPLPRPEEDFLRQNAPSNTDLANAHCHSCSRCQEYANPEVSMRTEAVIVDLKRCGSEALREALRRDVESSIRRCYGESGDRRCNFQPLLNCVRGYPPGRRWQCKWNYCQTDTTGERKDALGKCIDNALKAWLDLEQRCR